MPKLCRKHERQHTLSLNVSLSAQNNITANPKPLYSSSSDDEPSTPTAGFRSSHSAPTVPEMLRGADFSKNQAMEETVGARQRAVLIVS